MPKFARAVPSGTALHPAGSFAAAAMVSCAPIVMALVFPHVPAMEVILFLQPLEARYFLVLSARPSTSCWQRDPCLASEWPWILTAIQAYLLRIAATSSSVFLPLELMTAAGCETNCGCESSCDQLVGGLLL